MLKWRGSLYEKLGTRSYYNQEIRFWPLGVADHRPQEFGHFWA
jgi:hypothetical protein